MRAMGDTLTTRGRAFLAAGITLLAAGLGLGFADLTRVGLMVVVLPLVASGLTRRRVGGIAVTRESEPARATAGEVVTVTTTVANTGIRSTPLMLAEERLDFALGERPRVLLGSLDAQQVRALTYAVRPPVRGPHLLGPLTVQLRDPFGLTNRIVEVDGATELVVRPRTWPLGAARPPGTGVGAEGEIPFMVALHGEDDQSIREYRDGDDLRRIHWPATARTGELMVRQEDRPARRRAVVLLDPREPAHCGTGAGSSFEWAVSAAGSAVVHLAGLGYAVHLLSPETVQDGHADLPVDPQDALDILATTATTPALELAAMTRAGQGLLAGGGLLVAVLAPQDEQALSRIATLRQPGGTALGLVLDTASFGPPRESGRQPASPAAAARAVDLLRGSGWRASVVSAGDGIAQGWSRVGSVAARVGSEAVR